MDLRDIVCSETNGTDCEILFSCLSAEVKNFSIIFLFFLVFVIVYVYRLWLSDGLYLTTKCRSNNRYCYIMAFHFCGYWLNINC